MRDVLLRFGRTVWIARVDPHRGTSLRTLLREACLPLYNSSAAAINCRGLGTCGTCAVSVPSASTRNITPLRWRERIRLSLMPHSIANTEANQLRLACQCRLFGTAGARDELTVEKLDGMWGHRHTVQGAATAESDEQARGAVLGGSASLNMAAIRAIKPEFPRWLQQEMRSNHAGETGAVNIYVGCLAALKIRRTKYFRRLTSNNWHAYEDRLESFALEHEESERMHLVWLNEVLDNRSIFGGERSVLLPAWRIAGFTLGFFSTIWCPRGMYVTTDAVESFVEEHYQGQIVRLQAVISEMEQTRGGRMVDGSSAGPTGQQELLRMLELCCEDEVHHQMEARERAAEGPLPWFAAVDWWWHKAVFAGSWLGAETAKRI